MAREMASPFLANIVAARVSPEEFNRRAAAPLTAAELSELRELSEWFTRRYPTVDERFAYARRKWREIQHAIDLAGAQVVAASYQETARQLAEAHRRADPRTTRIFLDPDPKEQVIRLLEVTASAPDTGCFEPVEFIPRPDLGVPFRTLILLLGVGEWARVEAGELELPWEYRLDYLLPL